MPTNPLGSALLMNKNKKPHYSGFTDNIQYSHKWGVDQCGFFRTNTDSKNSGRPKTQI